MPSIVGPVKITNVTSAGQVNFGDALNISPKNNSKSYGGSGTFATGDFHFHNEWISNTNTLDSDGVDETLAANN
jgi:spore germination protein PF